MKKLTILFILVWNVWNINAQKITGHVYNANDKSPIAFGNVVLQNLPDSSFKAGVVTYMEGEYSFENIQSGKYLLKASYVGYEPFSLDLELKEGTTALVVDDIFLKEISKGIEEVEVKADMIRGKELVDRTVYDIPPEIEKTSSTGYDVLKKIPGVQVDFNNNITISGKNNYIIQVDGKQRDAEFLNRIMPEDIESIEIINNPSGRYDGSVDAVMNIILKPMARVGISGNIGTMYKPSGHPTAAITGGIDYGLEKITFYASGFSFLQQLQNNTSSSNKYFISAIDSLSEMHGTGDFNINASSINTGFDYYINKKNSISLNYNIKPNIIVNDLENQGVIYLNNNLEYNQNATTHMKMNSNENNISLFYKKKFEKPIQEFTMESNYYFFNSKDDNAFENNILGIVADNTQSSNRNETTKNNRNYLSTKIDYVHPLNMSMRMEGGIQAYYQQMDYSFISSQSNFDQQFDYNEFRGAAYIGYTLNLKKIGYQANLRIERSAFSISDTTPNPYNTLLPSSTFQYKINGNQNIKLTYNRRINRPNIYSLNPNIRLNNNLTLSTGNPDLKPEYRDRLELKYTLNFGKNFFSPMVYYDYMKNKTGNRNYITQSPLTENLTLISKTENLITGYETGLGVTGFIKFVYIDGRIYSGKYNAFNDAFSSIPEREYFSYSFTNYYTLPLLKEKLNTYALINYNGITIDAQSKTYNPFIYGFGANYKHKDHTFGFFYVNPLQKELQFNKTVTDTEFLYSENISKFDLGYFIQLQYHYKFNKGRAVKKIGNTTKIESDTKGGGLGR